MKQRRAWIILGVLAFLAALLLESEAARTGVRQGLRLCGQVLIPSLLPFCVGAKLLVSLGPSELLRRGRGGWMGRLFHLPEEAALPLFLGLVGGYPLGMQLLGDLRRDGAISRKDGIALSAFCNNAGPAFLMGAVGAGVFGAPGTGLALYLIHAVSALFCGFLLRGTARPVLRTRKLQAPVPLSRAVTNALRQGTEAMLQVCGVVTFFSGCMAVIRRLLPSVLPDWASALLYGFVELTGGCAGLRGCRQDTAFLAAAALAGWGGCSVHLQAADALRGTDLPLGAYLKGKLLHSCVSFLLAMPACALLYGGGTPVLLLPPMVVLPALLIFFRNWEKQHWKSPQNML